LSGIFPAYPATGAGAVPVTDWMVAGVGSHKIAGGKPAAKGEKEGRRGFAGLSPKE
jgi:hypothetical protein